MPQKDVAMIRFRFPRGLSFLGVFPARIRSSGPKVVLIAFALLASSLLASRAQAYPWMLRHGHPACVQCHMDPSGSGLLTAYGREAGNEELPMTYGRKDAAEAQGPAWGLVKTPDWLLLGAGFRGAILATKISGLPVGSPGTGASATAILMQADARAGIRLGGWRASVSLGGVQDASYAAVAGPLVSREHWVGYAFDHDALVMRAGRMNLPFGIRSIEHTLWVRQQTRTDINDRQQHGVALAYTKGIVRGELMGVLGNYQISPDAFRERGYSGAVEVAPVSGLGVGVSSLLTHAGEDIRLRVAETRQAHGLFVRASPFAPLVVLGEGDLVINTPQGSPTAKGFASMLQGDVEPLQGLHLIVTGETWTPGGTGTLTSYGGWAAIDWFCFRQIDLRADFMWRSMAQGSDRLGVTAFLLQAHIYL